MQPNNEMELLNRKLDIIFDMLVELKENLDGSKMDKDLETMEEQLKRLQKEVEWKRDNKNNMWRFYSDRRDSYYRLNQDFYSRREEQMRSVEEVR